MSYPLKFRPMRGTLKDSLADGRDFETRAEFDAYISEWAARQPMPSHWVPQVSSRYHGYDHRTDRDEHMVLVADWGPIGFSTGEV